MGEFFKPLRRKIGVLTLVGACVFTAGWLRSLAVEDYFPFRAYLQNADRYSFISGIGTRPHTLFLLKPIRDDGDTTDETSEVESEPVVVDDSSIEDRPIVDREYFGFITIGCVTYPQDVSLARIPFGTIVIPLALLSAWLLISRPTSVKRVLAAGP